MNRLLVVGQWEYSQYFIERENVFSDEKDERNPDYVEREMYNSYIMLGAG